MTSRPSPYDSVRAMVAAPLNAVTVVFEVIVVRRTGATKSDFAVWRNDSTKVVFAGAGIKGKAW